MTESQTRTVRQVGEWALRSAAPYANPFADVVFEGEFVSPQGMSYVVPGFYDGDGTWRLRFSPNEAGRWRYRTRSRPNDASLTAKREFAVAPAQGRGYLKATPRDAWGFRYEDGEPAFILGDTTYNLFGMAHCGADVAGFLKRRASQGFNLLRVRVPVSPFHPPEGYSDWQTRRTWPWGGSEQKPLFDRFDLGYFRTVDQVMAQAEALGLGFEVIMEAWGFEFPFCRRDLFVPEWEELWLRYLIARYDAYSCVSFWTLMNEYEYYPDGDWRYNPLADRWAMRMARWVKAVAPHGHIVSVHNGPRLPPFAQRFALDPDAVDAIMFQDWGARDESSGWLATGIEETIVEALRGWRGSAVFAEWGYERNPEFALRVPGHRYCDEEHTRRGGWRGAFCGLGVIHGFENSWGPWERLGEDQSGLVYLQHLHRFFTKVLPFSELRPAWEIVRDAGRYEPGHRPLALASPSRDRAAVYLPAGGAVSLDLPRPVDAYASRWYDPCTGELSDAQADGATFHSPDRLRSGHPQDWVLVLRMA